MSSAAKPAPPAAEPVPRFDPPGPGAWSLDTTHFPQPATRFVMELFTAPARRGFKEATARYGLLMDHIEWGFVHRWAYLCPRPVRALSDGMTHKGWDELVGSDALLRGRLASSATVFADRRWHEDVTRWDRRTKPQLSREHRELQAVQPMRLQSTELLSHLSRCRRNLQRAIYEHHCLNVAPVIPVGDFLVHAQEWTGLPAADLVGLVRDDRPLASAAGTELTRLAQAMHDDPAAEELLASGDETGAGGSGSEGVLASLRSWPGDLGRAAADYLDLVGCWSAGSGSDVGEPCLVEMPNLLVGTIRAAGPGGPRSAELTAGAALAAVAELAAERRAQVPPSSRDAFDALLAEARATHRLRDERAAYCDVWAHGLMRRAILAAGRRLTEGGIVEAPEHLVEATDAELRSLIEGAPGPSGEELAARARYRLTARQDDVPAGLGSPPPAPVPIEWLAPGVARTERAFRTYLRAMSGEEVAASTHAIAGVGVSPGTHTGRARIVRSVADLSRIEPGDVLVTGSTTPALNPVLPLIGAIVTDRGGLLSHAAIVAREFGIPAVVGTGDGTAKIPDGALVLVDGTAGQATVLDPQKDSNRSR